MATNWITSGPTRTASPAASSAAPSMGLGLGDGRLRVDVGAFAVGTLLRVQPVVQLKPDSGWRARERWYSGWAPEWLKDAALRRVWSDRITWDELVAEMGQVLRIPGETNAWTMPIKARIEMLSTGVRTPVGINVTTTIEGRARASR